jgi:hypothetical protein
VASEATRTGSERGGANRIDQLLARRPEGRRRHPAGHLLGTGNVQVDVEIPAGCPVRACSERGFQTRYGSRLAEIGRAEMHDRVVLQRL